MQIPKFNQTSQQLDNRSSLKRLKRSDDELQLPENFEIRRAISDGNCFFDSFKQGLEQLGVKVEIGQLRQDCKKFAESNPPGWFKDAVANSYDNNFVRRRETPNSYAKNILNSDRWGDSDIEGRILCEKYNVKLHIIEKQSITTAAGGWLHQIIDGEGSRSVSDVDYDDSNSHLRRESLPSPLGFRTVRDRLPSYGSSAIWCLSYTLLHVINILKLGKFAFVA